MPAGANRSLDPYQDRPGGLRDAVSRAMVAPMNGNGFFRPLWIRGAIVAVCALWAAFEWRNGETGWAVLAAAAAVYGVWSFFIARSRTGGKE